MFNNFSKLKHPLLEGEGRVKSQKANWTNETQKVLFVRLPPQNDKNNKQKNYWVEGLHCISLKAVQGTQRILAQIATHSEIGC